MNPRKVILGNNLPTAIKSLQKQKYYKQMFEKYTDLTDLEDFNIDQDAKGTLVTGFNDVILNSLNTEDNNLHLSDFNMKYGSK